MKMVNGAVLNAVGPFVSIEDIVWFVESNNKYRKSNIGSAADPSLQFCANPGFIITP